MAALAATARVTPAEVKEIFDTTLTGDALNPFINVAHYLIESKNLAAKGIGSDLLKQIELWLSAHFTAVLDPRARQEDVAGEYGVTWELGKAGDGLMATTYGQQAVALDISGTLRKLDLKQAGMKVISEFDIDFVNIGIDRSE